MSDKSMSDKRIDELQAELETMSRREGALHVMLANYGFPTEPKALAGAIERERNANASRISELQSALEAKLDVGNYQCIVDMNSEGPLTFQAITKDRYRYFREMERAYSEMKDRFVELEVEVSRLKNNDLRAIPTVEKIQKELDGDGQQPPATPAEVIHAYLMFRCAPIVNRLRARVAELEAKIGEDEP